MRFAEFFSKLLLYWNTTKLIILKRIVVAYDRKHSPHESMNWTEKSEKKIQLVEFQYFIWSTRIHYPKKYCKSVSGLFPPEPCSTIWEIDMKSYLFRWFQDIWYTWYLKLNRFFFINLNEWRRNTKWRVTRSYDYTRQLKTEFNYISFTE